VIGSQPTLYGLAVLAGLAAAALVAAAATMVLPRPAPPPSAPRPAPTTPAAPAAPAGRSAAAADRARGQAISAADAGSVLAVRRIAARQLREAGRQVQTCAGAGGRGNGARCVRWPLAHLAVAGRVNARLLYGLGEPLPLGRCRETAMAAGGGMRVLGGSADQLVRGVADTSATGRRETAQRLGALPGLIAALRRQLHPTQWRACRAGPAR
jgi:hypothetical protein